MSARSSAPATAVCQCMPTALGWCGAGPGMNYMQKAVQALCIRGQTAIKNIANNHPQTAFMRLPAPASRSMWTVFLFFDMLFVYGVHKCCARINQARWCLPVCVPSSQPVAGLAGKCRRAHLVPFLVDPERKRKRTMLLQRSSCPPMAPAQTFRFGEQRA